MKLVLAMDLRQNLVVHGKSGQRAGYKPLDWGCSPTAEPVGFVKAIRPKYIYIADLDRIERTGAHDTLVRQCAAMTGRCWVDRGCRSPGDLLEGYHIENIIGTETGGDDPDAYGGGFLSLDIKAGKVIPHGRDPVAVLRQANAWKFSGCIVLDITGVGTEGGLDPALVERMRSAYHRQLFWGGGVASVADLEALEAAGFDGAIIATAVHRGRVPLAWIRRGRMC